MAEGSKHYELIVNGQRKEWEEPKITYDQVVKLAYPNPPTGPNVYFRIQYSRGPDENPRGVLEPGQSVFVKSGMLFDVVPTDRS